MLLFVSLVHTEEQLKQTRQEKEQMMRDKDEEIENLKRTITNMEVDYGKILDVSEIDRCSSLCQLVNVSQCFISVFKYCICNQISISPQYDFEFHG